ncbi:hypothetical protein [Cypionkella sp.]|uniref:hypothetical protein n=1 Tax=Cypionkella sp. TaxID=2811411 RepID=UPI002628B971|nr:hypothetical protein [Cypionkella sp.]MDB5666274.1 hypothetical protein [Cypionkella sp.]
MPSATRSGGHAQGDMIGGFADVLVDTVNGTIAGSCNAKSFSTVAYRWRRLRISCAVGVADQFVFITASDSTASAAGRDLNYGFSRAEADHINLTAIDTNPLLAQNESLVRRRSAAFNGAHGAVWRSIQGRTRWYKPI